MGGREKDGLIRGGKTIAGNVLAKIAGRRKSYHL